MLGAGGWPPEVVLRGVPAAGLPGAARGPVMHVAFVCTYNRARSVMAATMFEQGLRERGLHKVIRVTSAGTSRCAGEPADSRARRVLLDHGYPDPVMHRATQFDDEDLAADLVVVMTGQHSWDLQRRGVDPARVRLLRSFDPRSTGHVDVGNPCFRADFDRAFGSIEAAMPGLLDWFGRPPRALQSAVAYGWRFWIARPDEDVLRSPYYGLGEVPPWPAAEMRATCRLRKGHETPVSGCACGVYADHSVEVARARARCFPEIVQKWGPFAERGFRADDWIRFVGVCSLGGAEVVPIVVQRMDFVGTRIIREITPSEIRAKSAEIQEMYVYSADSARPGARELAEKVRARYRVPVHCRGD